MPFLLMPIGAEESDLRAAQEASDTLPNHVANCHERDESEKIEQCFVRIRRRNRKRTVLDFIEAHDQHDDQDGTACKEQPDRRSLPPRRATHDLRAASAADTRAFRNERIAVRADEFIHDKNVAFGGCGGEIFLTFTEAR